MTQKYSFMCDSFERKHWINSSSEPFPDLRMMILHPSPLPSEHWPRLQRAGWGLCHLPRILPPSVIKNPHFKDCYSKLHVWNMTHYQKALWLDSDVLVTGVSNSVNISVVTNIKPGPNQFGE